MKYSIPFTVALSIVTSVYAVPTKRDPAAPTDIEILNFALTLEHLESAFYTQGLAKYSEQNFLDAGLEPWARGRFVEIAEHESTHVSFLTKALGDAAVKPCEYSFPDTDPKSFVDVSDMLETVGVSAYTGAARFIDNKDYLTAAATILDTETRQSAWINSAVRHGNPWSTSFETPLGLNQVYSLASGFIKSCPSTNAALPVKAFPALAISTPVPGQASTLTFDAAPKPNTQYYAAFVQGLTTTFVPLGGDGGKQATIPKGLVGTFYVVVTSDGTTVSDANTVAGPAMLMLAFNSEGMLETLSL